MPYIKALYSTPQWKPDYHPHPGSPRNSMQKITMDYPKMHHKIQEFFSYTILVRMLHMKSFLGIITHLRLYEFHSFSTLGQMTKLASYSNFSPDKFLFHEF